jgi:hypothetical protein
MSGNTHACFVAPPLRDTLPGFNHQPEGLKIDASSRRSRRILNFTCLGDLNLYRCKHEAYGTFYKFGGRISWGILFCPAYNKSSPHCGVLSSKVFSALVQDVAEQLLNLEIYYIYSYTAAWISICPDFLTEPSLFGSTKFPTQRG